MELAMKYEQSCTNDEENLDAGKNVSSFRQCCEGLNEQVCW